MPVVERVPVLTRLVWCAAATLPVGVAAGFVWLWLAHPAEWEVRGNGMVLTEAASRGQFSVIVVFVLIGAVASFGWSWVTGHALAELGWMTTVVVILGTVAAAVIAWRLGVELGPPDPRTVTGAAVGAKLPSELAVDGFTPFLAWPIFGLLGLLGATWWDGGAADEDAAPDGGASTTSQPR